MLHEHLELVQQQHFLHSESPFSSELQFSSGLVRSHDLVRSYDLVRIQFGFTIGLRGSSL